MVTVIVARILGMVAATVAKIVDIVIYCYCVHARSFVLDTYIVGSRRCSIRTPSERDRER